MPLILNAAEQAAVEAIKTSSLAIQTQGVSIDTNGDGSGDTPYCTDLPTPTPGYADIIKAGSKDELMVADGFRVAAIPVVHHLAPFGFHGENLAPSLDFSAVTDVLTYTVAAAERLSVPRKAKVTIEFSTYVTATSTGIEYWLEVNGVPTSHYKCLIAALGDHRCLSGSWLVDLPAGALEFKIRASRFAGAGNIKLDSNNFAALTALG
jgi:hypothetical protein